MFDVTEDVIDYLKGETRNEEEFQKIWAELVKWKADRDEEMKKAEQERKQREAERERELKIAELRVKAASAQAEYIVALFADSPHPANFKEVYEDTLDAFKGAEKAVMVAKDVSKKLAQMKANKDDPNVLKAADAEIKSDDEKLNEYLRKMGYTF